MLNDILMVKLHNYILMVIIFWSSSYRIIFLWW